VKTKPTPEASPPKEKPAAEKTDSSSEFGGDAPDQL
jgi:hypothetical protein